ncbi:MAG: glycosyltransferase family 2 protein [Terrimonas sp.]|nr:glycosyltransferase family 2 protein [Terrimonas sp.]
MKKYLAKSTFKHYFAAIIFSMVLSVIIVNYNVKYFLEQCLLSVYKAGSNIDMEVIVVDNNSTDGSTAYIQRKFPRAVYHVIKENLGFAKACNYGLQLSQGTHILFLNPDTILPEDSLEKCIQFLDTHTDAGALGVRMLDGSGNFLKESKRGKPSLTTTFFKLTGLSSLFPRSTFFAKYYLTNIGEYQTSAVDILPGAFMMIKKNVLDITGSFDEVFFMYGEDIDLSYRIQQAGFENYYLPEVSIIHFKGESTQKESFRYVYTFYNAMSIFVSKHYKGSKGAIYRFMINAAILLRYLLSIINKIISKIIRVIKRLIFPGKQNGLLHTAGPLVLTGSPETIANAESIVKDAGFSVIMPEEETTRTTKQTYTVVYCEGERMSFGQIIKQLDETKPCNAMIYAWGSTSIVGSPGRNKRGETISYPSSSL